jgi:hypothetical protein
MHKREPALALLASAAIITGQVTDPNGAVIAGAHVAAHNLDTGVTHTQPPMRLVSFALNSCPSATIRSA